MPDRPAGQRLPYVAVIGDRDPGGPDAHRILEMAEEVGQLLARGGAIIVTGGLGGVMRAAAQRHDDRCIVWPRNGLAGDGIVGVLR